MAGQFDLIQPVKASSAGNMLLPIVLTSYSTRGGTSGKQCLVSSPSRSKFRSVNVSMRCDIPLTPFLIAEKRSLFPGASARTDMTSIVHLSPRRARTSWGAQGVRTGPFAMTV